MIRAKIDEGAVSCIYIFLPGKDTRHYRELFTVVQREIRRTGAHINLETITVHFERGAYGAFQSFFVQHIDNNGCFFHLSQSTQRKAGDLDFKPYIMDDSERLDPSIRMLVAMIDAMAFVPIADLQVALNALNNNVPDPQVPPLLEYFVCAYANGRPIPNTIPRSRWPPMFLPQIWNVYEVTLEGGDRTINVCEGNCRSGRLSRWEYVGWEIVFWENVEWETVVVGNCLLGNCRVGHC